MSDDAEKAGNDGASLEQDRSPDEVVRLFLQAERLRQTARRVGRRWSRSPDVAGPVADAAAPRSAPPPAGVGSIRMWRPTPRQASIALIGLIVLAIPLLVPSMLLLTLVLLAISYLSLGHDRSAEMAAAGFAGWSRRDPEAAEKARDRAARVSGRLSVWAGYLPEKWTRGLYLPDFETPDPQPEHMQGDPFDRLKDNGQR